MALVRTHARPRATRSRSAISTRRRTAPPGRRAATRGRPVGQNGGANGAGDANGLPRQLRNLIDRPVPAGGGRFSPNPGGFDTGGTDTSGRLPASLVVLVIAAVALLVALVIPPARALGRRRRIRRAGHEPRALILATYDVFTERAADLGHPRGRGETLEEYRRRLGSAGAIDDGQLDRLTAIAGRAAYARGGSGGRRRATSLRRRVGGAPRPAAGSGPAPTGRRAVPAALLSRALRSRWRCGPPPRAAL